MLPGAAWVEKDATYTNDQGLVQAASRAINPPGEAVEDWQILTSVAAALGLPYTYTTVAAGARRHRPGAAGEPSLRRARRLRPSIARWQRQHWLQASNPMERMKWNDMFQDLPPVKGHNVQMEQSRRSRR